MEKEHYNVLVVGAGVVGCATAYYVAKAGLRVALLDKGRIACEASQASFLFFHYRRIFACLDTMRGNQVMMMQNNTQPRCASRGNSGKPRCKDTWTTCRICSYIEKDGHQWDHP